MNDRPDERSRDELLEQIARLEERLADSEEMLRAITHGEVDALVVNTPNGNTIFTLEGADKPYRILIEQMNEGAVTISKDGTIIYSNSRMADILRTPLEMFIGQKFEAYVLPLDRQTLRFLIDRSGGEVGVGRISLIADDGTLVPVRISISKLQTGDVDSFSMILSDITEAVKAEESLRRMNEELEIWIKERTSSLERTNHLLKAEIIDRVIVQRRMIEEKEIISKVLNGFGYGLVATDERGRIILINRAGEKITGWNASDVSGKQLQDVFTLELESGGLQLAFFSGAEDLDGIAEPRPAVLRSRTGDRVHIECTAASSRGGDGKDTRSIVMFREVSGGRP